MAATRDRLDVGRPCSGTLESRTRKAIQMTDAHEKDDEHYAPESGEPDEDSTPQVVDPEHDKDDEHYAPES